MNCLEFRRSVGAEPSGSGLDLARHRAGCAACAAYQDELLALDALLARAMRIPLETAGRGARAAAAGPRRRTPAARGLALAASVLVGVLVAATLWVSYPARTIASEVMNHVAHEPEAWTDRGPLGDAALRAVLDPSGIRFRGASADVTYARRCLYAGRWVPHLVVRTARGPVTVLLLTHRRVAAAVRLEQHDFAGVVLPAPRGSMAVVGRNVAGLEDIARQVLQAVEWDA